MISMRLGRTLGDAEFEGRRTLGFPSVPAMGSYHRRCKNARLRNVADAIPFPAFGRGETVLGVPDIVDGSMPRNVESDMLEPRVIPGRTLVYFTSIFSALRRAAQPSLFTCWLRPSANASGGTVLVTTEPAAT